MKLTVTITPDHVRKHGAHYDNPVDCPLYHALKEQHPEFEFKHILVSGIIAINDGKMIKPLKGRWDAHINKMMMKRIITEPVVLEYETDHFFITFF